MNIFRIAFVAALTAFAASAQAQRSCADAKTTIELRDCLSAELELADKKMEEYLKAAQVGVDEIKGSTNANTVDLSVAQKIWERYRSAHCGDVYVFWIGGSIRYEQTLRCQIALTQERTHTLWADYLTTFGGSPPTLPEP